MQFTIQMKVLSTFYPDFTSKTVDLLLKSSFLTKKMPKSLIFDAFTLLIRENNDANYTLLRSKTFSLKIWLCKIFDKCHVYIYLFGHFPLETFINRGRGGSLIRNLFSLLALMILSTFFHVLVDNFLLG